MPRPKLQLVVFSIILAFGGAACSRRVPGVATASAVLAPVCDDSLWQHVYTGDPARFSKPQDRLQIINPCITVTGIVFSSVAEKDGDVHIRVALDRKFRHLLNAKNKSGQGGHLVVEPMCVHTVTQPDTLKEGVCNEFSQTFFSNSMKGKHVRITGAWVTDLEHGWNEIHPR